MHPGLAEMTHIVSGIMNADRGFYLQRDSDPMTLKKKWPDLYFIKNLKLLGNYMQIHLSFMKD